MWIAAELRTAAFTHAKLLDQFIALVQAEMEQVPAGSVQESLAELLEDLRNQRRSCGMVGGVQLVKQAA